MSTGEQGLDEQLRRKTPQTEPYMTNSSDLSRWPEIAPDLERLDGYIFTDKLGQALKRPTVYNLADSDGNTLLYPVMPNRKNGDYKRASQEELLDWKRSMAQKAGLPVEEIFIGPAYHYVDTTIPLEDGGTFPAKVSRQDIDHLALYTEKRLP